MGELQKANMWKRISAALFDLIMLAVVAIGVAWVLTVVFNYDQQSDLQLEQIRRYESQYGVTFDLSAEQFEKLTEDEMATYEKAYQAYLQDPEVQKTNALMLNMTILIVTFALLFAYLIWELIIPLILRNGQTLGKKIFGLAVIREDGVRVTPFILAVRTVLGKYTVEVMLPVFIIIMFLFNVTGIVGVGVLLILTVGQIILVAATRARTPLHDLFSRTVVVDLASQRIFDTVEEKDAYYLRLHREMTDRADY